ncbi:hypothetical protein C5Y96_15785 [Blastopirellula marina]|uniref:Uncharacterized protein n=1 Tax=Blastopirellula marina TaxID=124 RepID=A0A2S8FAN6_9BACT|nr:MULTISPECIES: hypothetical protein [Pirellulaceae]PQO29207.1 hypothetical protein C5Y96_15785 [Blastopirellula marina]RCS50400.1 hypothetical protein DTL36_15805 [Bremerella cremea]
MKLVQATCACGFQTHKARSGYHYHQWWFPVFSSTKSQLSDIELSLPEEDRDRLSQFDHQAYLDLPDRSIESKQKMREDCEEHRRSVHEAFVNSQLEEFREAYANSDESTFNPLCGDALMCPVCRKRSLILRQVEVLAFCHPDCGHEYRWEDSEEKGCPRCDYRPHRFKIVTSGKKSKTASTKGYCDCASTCELDSHVDGFCPKCGKLPVSYEVDGVSRCGMHHETMLPYRMPTNIFFVEPLARWVQGQFPNAKIYGDAAAQEESIQGRFCPSCEADHQRWLRANVEDYP